MIRNTIDSEKTNFIVLGEPGCGKSECIATLLNRSPSFSQTVIPSYEHFTMLRMNELVEVALYEANFGNAGFLLNAEIIDFDFLMSLTVLVVVPYDKDGWDYTRLSAILDKLRGWYASIYSRLTAGQKSELEKRFARVNGSNTNPDAEHHIPTVLVLHRYDLFLKDAM